MTHLDDVLDIDLLGQLIDEGYVQVRYHPDYPYAIYCYTKLAMFDRKWNEVTKVCRGLIVNEDSGEVLARPFKKFFNLGEPDAPVWNHTDWVSVYDKADGSLGIAYDTPDGPAIATKGSFTSEQALKATELLRTKYPRYVLEDEYTDLFEIIYPDNRIVLDYGDEESLRYLGSVWIDDGSDWWNGCLMRYWDIPRNKVLQSAPFSQLKLDMNRPNAEGYVLFNEDTGERLKVKQEDYLELHKVMTGLNERQIWEWFATKHNVDEVLVDLPEELHDWVTGVWEDLGTRFDELSNEVIEYFFEHGFNTTRKDFALTIKDQPKWKQGALWARYDGNFERVGEIVWKQLKP